MTDGPGSASSPPAEPRDEFVEEVEVVVEKLVSGGDGLARWQGLPVFIPRSAPGDRLLVRLTEHRSDYGRAEIVEILSPGEGRRVPPCPHFGECGGCDLQHLDDDLQTRLKAIAVQETLARLGGIRGEIDVAILKGQSWAYRQRTQIHTEEEGESIRIGYRSRRGHKLVAIGECPVLVPELEEQVLRLPDLLATNSPQRLDLLAGDDREISVAPKTAALRQGGVTVSAGGTSYELDARCFFQAHRHLLGKLIECVVGDWQNGEAYDLYAGVGFFSLPLASHYEKVVAVEGDRVAGRYLERNCRLNRLENLDYVHSAVESWIDRLPAEVARIVIDPPRTGLSGKVRALLCHRKPRRITYVSCHPATLARDLKTMTDFFAIEKITMVDMFPQTGHMEVVVQLVY